MTNNRFNLGPPRSLAVAAGFVLVMVGAVPAAAAPPVREVEVVNEPTVHSILLPSKQPYQRGFFIEIPAGTLSASESFSVPADKRLVIEWVGGSTRVSAWENVRMEIATQVADELVAHEIAPSVYKRDFEGSDPPILPDFQVRFSQPVKLYADPGSTVTVTVLRSENLEITPSGFGLSLSGHLVNCEGDPACPIP